MRRYAALGLAVAAAVLAGGAQAEPPPRLILSPLGIEMVLVPGVEKPFYLSRFEITQGQWERVMRSNPSRGGGCPECPVSRIGWRDADFFVSRASVLTGRTIRIPTETEWEYAAGGGEPGTIHPGTDDPDAVGRFSWFEGNSEGRCHPVGIKEPNAFGLYDMGGNVWEWCAASPAEGEGGPRGVLKGGSWREGIESQRIATRADRDPSWLGKGCLPLPLVPGRNQMVDVGFRVALDIP